MNEINIISEDKLAHYKKGTYSGSHKGMRYFISGKTTEDDTLTHVCAVVNASWQGETPLYRPKFL